MGPIYNALVKFFRDDEWFFVPIEEKSSLRIPFKGDVYDWTCFAQAREEKEQFVFYSVSPLKVPEEKRMEVSEYITRANYGLFIGNFELDFSDGEVRYKTSISFDQVKLTDHFIQPIVYINVLTMGQYLPGLSGIIYGNLSPEEAVSLAEQGREA